MVVRASQKKRKREACLGQDDGEVFATLLQQKEKIQSLNELFYLAGLEGAREDRAAYLFERSTTLCKTQGQSATATFCWTGICGSCAAGHSLLPYYTMA